MECERQIELDRMKLDSHSEFGNYSEVRRLAHWREFLQSLSSISMTHLASVIVFPLDATDGVDGETALSSDDQERLRTMTHSIRRRQFEVTRIRLRQLLGVLLDCTPQQVPITNGRFGKPELSSTVQGNLRFNVSHSGRWAAIAWSIYVEVGVDVETDDQKIKLDTLAQQLFEPAAYRDWQLRNEPDQQRMILDSWVLRESLLKALGIGISLDGYRFETLGELMKSELLLAVPLHPLASIRCVDPMSTSWSSTILPLQSVHHWFKLARFHGQADRWHASLACLLSRPDVQVSEKLGVYEISH